MKNLLIAILFYLAAAYDGILGVAFWFIPLRIFTWYGVTPPNHPGYVQFPALLLVLFALMFLAVARDPERNRSLIPYGIGLKLSFCGVVFWHWITAGIPGMWKPFAVADAVMAGLFLWAYCSLLPAQKTDREAHSPMETS